ncbi:hypothetical protein [Photobacterium sp. GSS17]|uniref:hypothetical protein n=1 Tax=Photobacterium sp. GSS17 TaxID=3020715 RepID=UPI002361C5EE|nr:hypothetical protein [Photobacterium sp. GSS17]
MAITIRNIEKHAYMIEELKSLTESNVTTKALIKGGYLAVELGKSLEEERKQRLLAEEKLSALQNKIQQYLVSQAALVDAVNTAPGKTQD